MPRDYPEYEDESPEETYRDPLKPFLIALVVLLLLFAAIIVLLYMRLQTANTRAETLSQELTAVQVQLDDLRAQRAAETPTPTPTEAPTPTPEPTPEPTATPEPTPEPTPTPAPLLRDTITAEMLGYVYRPADEFWYDEAKTAAVIPYMLAVHYGPGMDWGENMALNMGDTVEILAKQNGWVLLRTADGRYGWAAGELLRETADAPRGDGNARAGQPRRSGRAGRSRDGGSDGCPDAGLYRGLQSRSQIRTYTKILSLRCAERGFSFMTGSAAKGGGAALILCCPARSPWQNS